MLTYLEFQQQFANPLLCREMIHQRKAFYFTRYCRGTNNGFGSSTRSSDRQVFTRILVIPRRVFTLPEKLDIQISVETDIVLRE